MHESGFDEPAASAMPDCIVLAAGASSRMGECKPLLPWGSSTMAGTVIAAARSAGCRVVLVTGCEGERVRQALGSERGVEFIDNANWAKGMTGSIQSALPFVGTSRFFIIHADMPLVESRVYGILAAVASVGECPDRPELLPHDADSGSARVLPGTTIFAAWHGHMGHPVLVDSALIPGMMDLDPGSKLKDFIVSGGFCLIETECEGVILDIDTKEEYLRRRARPFH